MGRQRYRSVVTDAIIDPDAARVCMLTGASGRLGMAFCRLLSYSYAIAAVYHSSRPTFSTCDDRVIDPLHLDSRSIEREPAFRAYQADLTRQEEVSRVIDLVLERFGRVDLLGTSDSVRMGGISTVHG